MNNLKKNILIIFSALFVLIISLGAVSSADVSNYYNLDQSSDLNSDNNDCVVNNVHDLNSQNFACDSSDSLSLCKTSTNISQSNDDSLSSSKVAYNSKSSSPDDISSLTGDVYAYSNDEISLSKWDSGSTINIAYGDSKDYTGESFENMTFISGGSLTFDFCTFINTTIIANSGTLKVIDSKFINTDLFNVKKAITSTISNRANLIIKNNVFYNYFNANSGLINQNAAITYNSGSNTNIKNNTFTYDRFKVAMYIRLDGYPPIEIDSSNSSASHFPSGYYPNGGNNSFWAVLNRTYADNYINLDNVLINGKDASTTEGSIINDMIVDQNSSIQLWLNTQISSGNITKYVNDTFVRDYLNATNKTLYNKYISGNYNISSEGYTIWWYVLKSASSGEVRLHVDGVILPTLLFTLIKESVKADALNRYGYANTQQTISNLKVNQTINGTVTLTIYGNGYEKNYTGIKVIDGIVNDFTIDLADAGIYNTIVLFTPESEAYENTSALGNLTVYPYKTSVSNLTAVGRPGENINIDISVSVNPNVNLPDGSVVLINGTEYTVIDGEITLNLVFPNVGEVLNYTVVYNNRTNFIGSTGFISLSSTPYETSTVVGVSPITPYPNEKRNITAYITYVNGNVTEGTATLYIDGQEYSTVDINNGLAKFNDIEIINVDNHKILVKYNNASSNFLISEGETTLSLEKIPSTTIVVGDTVEYGNNVTINFNVTGDIPGFSLAAKMNVLINNNTYSIDVGADGQITLNLTGLKPGSYDVLANYLGNNYYLSSNNSSIVVVNKLATITNVSSTVITLGDNGIINVSVSGKPGISLLGEVILSIGNNSYTVAINENGTGTLNLSNLGVGKLDIAGVYTGNDFYLNSTGLGNIIVNSIPDPVVPVVPDTPIIPVDPVVPVVPDTPVIPVDPVVPVVPDTPVIPVDPVVPVVPDTPVTPIISEEPAIVSEEDVSSDRSIINSVQDTNTVTTPANSGIATDNIVNLLATTAGTTLTNLAGTISTSTSATSQQNQASNSSNQPNDLGIDFPVVIPMQGDNSWATLFVGLSSVLGLTELKRREEKESKKKKDNTKKDYKKE